MFSENERFEKAEKVLAKDYEGWVFWEDRGDNEGFFASVAEIRRYCEREEIELPSYVYACNPTSIAMRAEWIIDDALADHHENAKNAISCEAIVELQAALDAWCAKQTVRTWFQNMDRVVLLSG